MSSLRADAPIFKPRSRGMNEVVSLGPVSVGLEASIHAPRNEEILHTQGCVDSEASESMDATRQACAPTTISNTPERPVETGSLQATVDAVEEPESSGNAQRTISMSPKVTNGLHASIHAPPDSSAGTLQPLGENIEKSEKVSTHVITGSNPTDNNTRSRLCTSIHAPVASQSAQRSSKRQTDVPNWASICRAEKPPGTSGAGIPAFDGGASELSTTTRCATSDQEGSFVDKSDGSLVNPDDQEDTTGETDSTLGETDDPNEQNSTRKPSRKPRRRGGGRRPRKKMPYVPPPRMQSLPVTQYPVIDVRAQVPAQTSNVLAAPPASLNRHHYKHVPPAPPHHPTLDPGLMTPPNGVIYNKFGRYPHYYPDSLAPHLAPIPGFQLPGPHMHHNPRFYPGPYPHVSPHPPSALLYGR